MYILSLPIVQWGNFKKKKLDDKIWLIPVKNTKSITGDGLTKAHSLLSLLGCFLAYFINAQCIYRNAVVFSSWISIPNTAFLNVLLVFPHDHSIMWTTWGKRCNQIFNQGLVSIKKEKWVWSNQWPCTERIGHIYIFLCVAMQVYTCYVLSLIETDMKQNIFFITRFFKKKTSDIKKSLTFSCCTLPLLFKHNWPWICVLLDPPYKLLSHVWLVVPRSRLKTNGNSEFENVASELWNALLFYLYLRAIAATMYSLISQLKLLKNSSRPICIGKHYVS